MKNIFTLFILFASISLAAQYQKGDWYLAGASSIGLQAPLGSPERGAPGFFSVDAFRLGRFMTDRLLIGISPSLFVGEDILQSDGSVNFSLRPYARYYFLPKNRDELGFFAEGNLGSFSAFGGDRFFTGDYGLSGGAEFTLAPGLLVTAQLAFFHAEAFDINLINVGLGANVLLGQLESTPVVLRRGMLTSSASFGGIGYNWGGPGNGSLQRFRFDLSPEVGYFLTDRLLVSLKVRLSTSIISGSMTGFDELTTTDVNTSISPRIRYYLRGAGKLLPFVYAGTSGDFSSFNIRTSDRQNVGSGSSNVLGLEGGLGANYFLSPSVSFEGRLFYDGSGYNDDNQENRSWSTRLNLRGGFRFFFGASSESE